MRIEAGLRELPVPNAAEQLKIRAAQNLGETLTLPLKMSRTPETMSHGTRIQ